jgi:hypothetical protein
LYNGMQLLILLYLFQDIYYIWMVAMMVTSHRYTMVLEGQDNSVTSSMD